MLYTILLISEVFIAIALITLVLLQHGKGADAGAAFGSGASGTVFGARGAGNFLTRTTAILATLFFLNCLALTYIVSHQPREEGVVESLVEQAEQQGAPAGMAAPDEAAAPAAEGGALPPDVPPVDTAPAAPAEQAPAADLPD